MADDLIIDIFHREYQLPCKYNLVYQAQLTSDAPYYSASTS
jgi:hypothetical protein